MRVYRGRADAVDADRAVSERLVERVAADREPAVRVWRPHRQVAFGRRDARAERYDEARAVAGERGFPTVERDVGGRAVAYSGSTVAFARVTPVEDPRSGLTERYDAATADLLDALKSLDVDAREGEPAESFCPGTHSVQADCDGRARKLAGLAQRVRADAAVVAGVLLVRDHAEIAAVLAPVYEALDVPFDPETVGSVAGAGGEGEPDAVVEAVERALVEGEPASASIERAG
ncbi:biotin/lipoate A/B protein ligase [Halosimplex carlsbadense 2-9-1]|uniref:Biotin/lipoate A/B protein ligase n=1 Tax=Halosimplex carlsbadense 2-9-1 TaxID=797114 RepID=M0D0R0_9EURY|nr:lipoate--protein ligase family protein [Halosimplex carlsbadense]ELZ27744.1 biotin/lipoate A/B protein ligase [Halosimplex carlsbadense 2-9-1]